MEQSSGRFSHFGGIIRIVVVAILILALAFLIIRFIARRDDNQAQETQQTTQTNQADNTQNQKTEQEAENSDGSKDVTQPQEQSEAENAEPKEESSSASPDDNKSADQEVAQVPKGIADDQHHKDMPEAGLGTDILLTTTFISAAIYLFTKNRQLKNSL